MRDPPADQRLAHHEQAVRVGVADHGERVREILDAGHLGDNQVDVVTAGGFGDVRQRRGRAGIRWVDEDGKPGEARDDFAD